MKLDEFISNVLGDIENGLNTAKQKTGKGYYVQLSNKAGVDFDIAVTTGSLSANTAEGSAKVGFIEVLGAGVDAKFENKNEKSEVSRIQFTVFVPSRTQQEEAADNQRFLNNQQDKSLDPYQ